MVRKIVSIIYAAIEALKRAREAWRRGKLAKEMKHRDDKETTDNLRDILR